MPAALRTVTTYAEVDYQAILAVINGLTPTIMQAIVGTGWRGFFEFGTFPDPPPAPSADLRNPTMWAVFAEPQYFAEPVVTMDDAGECVSEGYVPIALLYQPGAPGGRRQAFFRKVREAFKAAATADGTAFLPEGHTERAKSLEGWLAQQINVRFVGVG
jgi:hypothetical protein